MPERDWFERHPLEVAFDLLGCIFAVERNGTRVAGRITEVEAYAGLDDLASHSALYKSARRYLFGEPGRLYMYRAYGIHTMLNIVAHEPDKAGAVLIRALEPVDGVDMMQERRGKDRLAALTVGPGVLCQALDLRLTDNTTDLIGSDVFLIEEGEAPFGVIAGPRVGITKAIDHPWRLFNAASAFVSSHRRGEPVTRDTLDYLETR